MASPWFVTPNPLRTPKLRLICFPYAGGNSSTYTPWANKLTDGVELVAVQPPGRAARLFEQAFDTMDSLIEPLLNEIADYTREPYVMYGHSLGSRVCFELIRQLSVNNMSLPQHFIASGSKAPHSQRDRKVTYNLPHDEFVEELRRMNGTPEEVLQNKELLEMLLPLLRADFAIAEVYQAEALMKYDCPVSVFGGKADKDVPIEKLKDWQAHFNPLIDIQTFPGGHFFIESDRDLVIEKVNITLESIKTDMLVS